MSNNNNTEINNNNSNNEKYYNNDNVKRIDVECEEKSKKKKDIFEICSVFYRRFYIFKYSKAERF